SLRAVSCQLSAVSYQYRSSRVALRFSRVALRCSRVAFRLRTEHNFNCHPGWPIPCHPERRWLSLFVVLNDEVAVATEASKDPYPASLPAHNKNANSVSFLQDLWHYVKERNRSLAVARTRCLLEINSMHLSLKAKFRPRLGVAAALQSNIAACEP